MTRCPACGGQTLFIRQGGHLTCSRLDCPIPAPEEVYARLRSTIAIARRSFGVIDENGLHLSRREAIQLFDQMDEALNLRRVP